MTKLLFYSALCLRDGKVHYPSQRKMTEYSSKTSIGKMEMYLNVLSPSSHTVVMKNILHNKKIKATDTY